MKFALTAMMFCLPAIAQLPQGTKPPGEDWVQAFNGKDLNGWNKVGKEEWIIEPNGVLRGRATTKEYGYLETLKTYRDFQMSLRFKCEGTGNSGIYFHTKFKPGTADVSQGAQFEIDCTIGRHTAASMALEEPGSSGPLRKTKRWCGTANGTRSSWKSGAIVISPG